jgi:hypothetical protein
VEQDPGIRERRLIVAQSNDTVARAFIAEIAGEETAAKVQFGSEYYPSERRYGILYKTPVAPAYLKKGSNRCDNQF